MSALWRPSSLTQYVNGRTASREVVSPTPLAGIILRRMQLAVEIRALLKGKTLVDEIAFDLSRGLQHHPERVDRANKATTDLHILGDDVTLKLRILPKYQRNATNVALNLTIDMKLTFRCHIACDY